MTEVEEALGGNFSDVAHLFEHPKVVEEAVGDTLKLLTLLMQIF